MNRIIIFCCLLISITAALNPNEQTSLEDTVAELAKIAEQNYKRYAKPLIIRTQNNTDSSVIPVKTTTKSKSYHVSSFKTDFLSALQWCFESDMKLATIMSNEETEKYVNQTKFPTVEYYWIGLTQTMYQGKYVWIKNGAEPVYINWSPGQPEGTKAKQCIVTKSDTGAWHDVPCSNQYSFVCENEDDI